jgi:hypothetical protein
MEAGTEPAVEATTHRAAMEAATHHAAVKATTHHAAVEAATTTLRHGWRDRQCQESHRSKNEPCN